MKTIEITSGNQTAQFTTKSVTVGGKEYFYANMANVENDIVSHIYTFTYEGEYRTLPYEEKDAKVLNAIFSQVQNLKPQQAAGQAPAPAAVQSSAPVEEQPESLQNPVNHDDLPKEQPAGLPQEDVGSEVLSAEPPTGESTSEPAEDAAANELPADEVKPAALTDEASPADQAAEEKSSAKLRVTDIFGKKKEKAAASEGSAEALTEPGTALPEAAGESAGSEKEEAADPEKKARLNKSLKIFGIIIAAILIASVIYYFVIGTPSDPAPANPNASESQQYDDIDELIEDLQ